MIDAEAFDRLVAGDRSIRVELQIEFARGDGERRHTVLDGIAARAAHGSSEATELLVELVHRFRLADPAIASVLVDPADIDDAAQLTLITIAERIQRFEGRAHFRTWLGAVARNEALQLLRRKSRKNEPSGADVPDRGEFVTRLSSVVSNEAAVRAALDRVSEPYREALELREMRQLEYDEIADLLGIPIGTVRSRIARAREQLAQQVWRWQE